MHSSDAFIPKYSKLVYNAFWFSPEREALQALVTETQRDVEHLRSYLLDAGSKSEMICS
jgi:argininosuccinate synthase